MEKHINDTLSGAMLIVALTVIFSGIAYCLMAIGWAVFGAQRGLRAIRTRLLRRNSQILS